MPEYGKKKRTKKKQKKTGEQQRVVFIQNIRITSCILNRLMKRDFLEGLFRQRDAV